MLAYMCGRLCCDGTSVVSHLKVQSEEIARGILYQNRPFVEWTDVEAVRARLMSYFPNPNRIDGALAPSVAYLKQMTRIRNAIAHTSKPSRDGFDKLVQSLYGGKVSFPRASKLLTAPHIHDRNKTFFDVYVTVLEIAAGSITG